MQPSPRPPAAFAGRPFHLGLSLALDRVIIALDRPHLPPAHRDALRREKGRLEQAVPTRKPRR